MDTEKDIQKWIIEYIKVHSVGLAHQFYHMREDIANSEHVCFCHLKVDLYGIQHVIDCIEYFKSLQHGERCRTFIKEEKEDGKYYTSSDNAIRYLKLTISGVKNKLADELEGESENIREDGEIGEVSSVKYLKRRFKRIKKIVKSISYLTLLIKIEEERSLASMCKNIKGAKRTVNTSSDETKRIESKQLANEETKRQ